MSKNSNVPHVTTNIPSMPDALNPSVPYSGGKPMQHSGLDPERFEHKKKIAHDTLERYAGCPAADFRSYLLLTNFPQYVDYFAESRGVAVHEGSMFKVAHSVEEDVTILDFKIGSPAAALVVDVCSFLPIKASLLLGMCGGLRRRYRVGDFFVPVAAIRCDGTSDFYFPAEVPALSNFVVQRAVTELLDDKAVRYHIGITHHTNIRFWEFDEEFTSRLKATRAQAIEMECATLFIASYKNKLPLGALLLISDLPLEPDGVKTKEGAADLFKKHTGLHVEYGVEALERVRQKIQLKGEVHGLRRRDDGPPDAT